MFASKSVQKESEESKEPSATSVTDFIIVDPLVTAEMLSKFDNINIAK
jgi:hypothetical protein